MLFSAMRAFPLAFVRAAGRGTDYRRRAERDITERKQAELRVVLPHAVTRVLAEELADEALRIRPDLPLILTSGYSATLTNERLAEIGISEFLMKPHSIETLGLCVDRVLTATASRTPKMSP